MKIQDLLSDPYRLNKASRIFWQTITCIAYMAISIISVYFITGPLVDNRWDDYEFEKNCLKIAFLIFVPIYMTCIFAIGNMRNWMYSIQFIIGVAFPLFSSIYIAHLAFDSRAFIIAGFAIPSSWFFLKWIWSTIPSE